MDGKCRLAAILFLSILAVTLSNDGDDMELVYDGDSKYPLDYPQPVTGRSGKLFSRIQSPVIDFMLQSVSLHYVPQKTGDFFDFLRDPYPLPGGLSAPYQEYDFVIVGAGSAGSIVASRLTEDRDTTVLLLEAGKPEMILTDVPALAPYLQSTEYSWPYYMEPQEGVCTGMTNGRCYWPRGKAVGGTSVINYMIYTRGRPQDWDRIARDGNYGWSYNDILKYFKKSEKASLKGYEKHPYRNTEGEVPVEFPPRRTKLLSSFLEAGTLLGHPTVDYNAPDVLGFGAVQATVHKGKRHSAAKAFLHNNKKRQNLHILPETRVTKVLIEPNSKVAYGVEYVRNGVKYTVRARKEVILSAGPIASPQLLMLSGIGPQQHLNSLGIPVIMNLPVGQRLYDHICFPGVIFELNVTGISFIESKILRIPEVVSWLQYGDNFMGTLGGVEGIGYIKTSVTDDPEPVPDIELIDLGGSILSDSGPSGSQAIRKGMRITDKTFHEMFASTAYNTRDIETWSIFPMLLHPKSFGRIELKDSNPFNNPIMVGNYLTDPKDVATFIASIRYIQRIAGTEPFQKFGAKIIRIDYPHCRGYAFDSDEYWECGLRTLTATLHHQIATTRMGPPGDPLAVVDPELRVYGVNNLRVVDSGVIPRTISAHTHAPAMAVGEKAADMIKSTWGSSMKSKILDVMLATKTFHVNPAEPDIFSFLRDQYDLPKEFKGPLAEYDFVVIGAGSAGSVLASRLSEGRKASVLLLEAGRGESSFTSIPVLAPLLQQTDYVWPYLMEYQPGVCTGMTDGKCFWPRGKAVGGTSVVNYMIYTRGLKEDWERIAADGNYGWSYEQVLPYYIKSERAVLRGLERSPYHGRNGDLNVEYVPFKTKLAKAFLEAAKTLGHRKVDYNSPDGFGFSYIQATIAKGRRVSSARAFLHDHKKRKNLHVLSSTRVTKILIDPQTKTATGVQFHRNGRMYEVRAKKEVILSAGPIESPHLLMLSGIGPSEQLLSFDIPVLQDLKVGQKLYDHISFPGVTFVVNTSNITFLEKNVATIRNAIQFDHYGDGPMSSLGGVETIGYIKTNISEEKGDYPDIELLGACASLGSDKGTVVAKGLRLTDWLYNVYKPLEDQEAFSILFMLLHPESKGYLRLKSKNPFDDLKMYGNYLTSPKDVATMVAAIRYIIKMVETAPFQKYGAKLYTKKFPNCESFDFGSDGYWECAVRTITSTLHHQIATCKMGPQSDPEAVVDPELRVHGVKNLRVVDSSIIPRTIAAHTNAPAIMIGEKAADMIKANWKLY